MKRFRVVLSMVALVLATSVGCGKSNPARSADDVQDSRGDRTSSASGGTITDPGPSPLASVAPTSDGWYDAEPLLLSLRSGERQGLAERAGITSLDSLPLYDLKVFVDPVLGTLDVKERAYVNNGASKPMESLVFRIYGNPNDQKAVGSKSRMVLIQGECDGRTCDVRQGPLSVITVRFEKPLEPGEKVKVDFELRGILQRTKAAETGLLSQGFGGVGGGDGTYGTLSTCEGFVSAANFFPVLGRLGDDGWEPVDGSMVGDFGSDELSHIRAEIETPALVKVAAPGVTVRSVMVAGQDGQLGRRHEVGAAMVRGFAFFAGETVDVVEKRVGEVVIRSLHKEEDREVAQHVLDVASEALRIFEKRFGPYPYTELDVVQAPLTGGAGGIEFSGLIAVASMLYRPFSADDALGKLLGMLGGEANPAKEVFDEMLEFTTAHEVAHQWWYSLVGSDSRAHPYVDESLAQYSTLLYFEDRWGKDRAERAAETHVRLNYVGMRLMGKPDGIVERAAPSFDPLSYAGLVYGKGPFFFREARKVMGDDAFFAALRAYADDHRFRTASFEGPLPYLAKGKRQEEVRKLARRWWREKHGDEDLGPIDLQAVVKLVLGKDAGGISPQIQGLFDLLGGASPPKSGSPSVNTAPQILEQLEKMLESF